MSWGDPYRDARVLVVGATGFIGRAVARSLVDAGARVWIGLRAPESVDLAAIFPKQSGHVVECDARRDESVRSAVRASAPQVVFNLAGYGIDPRERDDREAAIVNGRLPVELGRAVLDRGAEGWPGSRLVHAGSALEYGAAGGDLGESTIPLPTTTYGRTKLDGTLGLEELGGATVTARLFTVYGPGERPGRLLPSLLALERSTDRLPVTAGTQRRDFTFLGDVVEGMLRLGVAPPGDRTVNLATGSLTTVREFIETALDVLGIPEGRIGWDEIDTRPEEQSHEPVSIRRLIDRTGWRPRTDIREGIARTRQVLHDRHMP